MILVFGGTTEGKLVAELLDFLNEPYSYSTKTEVETSIKGKHVSGAMDMKQIVGFCAQHHVKLIINASHPFAVQLHQNIYNASVQADIPVVRFERQYPSIPQGHLFRCFATFADMVAELQRSPYMTLLSLTGVQTIPWFDSLRETRRCYFRVLASEGSVRMATSYGVTAPYLISKQPQDSPEEMSQLITQTGAEVVLTKESGDSGFFTLKANVARKLNIPLWVVSRPTLPPFGHTVRSQKELLQVIYQLKKTVLKKGTELRSGFTSGVCVTACAKACFIAIREQVFPPSVDVWLSDGATARFKIFPQYLEYNAASCTVIKDAGDDPDVIHAKEIGCVLRLTDKPGSIVFKAGKGIGTITLPGLQLPVGEPAINPVPRRMVAKALEDLLDEYETEAGFEVEPFVPEGEELAKQTFNPRVGVIGGISVIGTTGKVMPFSNEAFITSIRYQLSVAREAGLDEVVLTAGKRSENIVKPQYPLLPDTGFIHYGNSIGETLSAAADYGFGGISLALMLGKAAKLAQGHMDTHSHKATIDIGFIVQTAIECGYGLAVTESLKPLTLANAIPSVIPFSDDEPFYLAIAQKSYEACKKYLPRDVRFKLFLINDNGGILCVPQP